MLWKKRKKKSFKSEYFGWKSFPVASLRLSSPYSIGTLAVSRFGSDLIIYSFSFPLRIRFFKSGRAAVRSREIFLSYSASSSFFHESLFYFFFCCEFLFILSYTLSLRHFCNYININFYFAVRKRIIYVISHSLFSNAGLIYEVSLSLSFYIYFL